MKKKKCAHINKKNLNSNKFVGESNVVEVECIDCGSKRSETRYDNGRIDASKWFRL